MARWHFCNVLRVGQNARQLWQFQASSRKFPLQKEETKLPGESLTNKLFTKDWEHLLHPRINVAWLPSQSVFLRLVQLPKVEREEIRAMLELQLEKLSPLPVAQIVWSYELLDQSSGEMLTAVVIIVSRHQVEAFLGELETIGYYSDRLELPFLDQLRAEDMQQDGVWIYAGWGDDPHTCLTVWRQEGALCSLCLMHLPEDERQAAVFQEQLRQLAWAGELEGWLKSDPKYFLVAESDLADSWRPLFELDQPLGIVQPMQATELATRTARRVASNSQHTNLLPPEYAGRYKQRFVDRLWMRGVAAAVAIYMIGVAVYFGWVEVAQWKLDHITRQVASLGMAYTNALKMKEEIQVLENQLSLQYTALDCWKAASDNLPPELTLDQFNFQRGRRVTYFGLVSNDDVQKVNDFYDAMREVKVNNQRLFKYVQPPRTGSRPPNQKSWNFYCDLERSEAE